ncbi:hypothetical protein [uncultured Ruminococcus sp.]|uniref:hypothetical protein n=1 Tax=uncultured Ruminococcus sp. TaxID=165186 RepID=UPI0025FE6D19|nr:hypothetical protein [uncultured Ruminococcus sp.]
MKITTFNPMIMTPKADDVIRLFEELGFEKRHVKTGLNDEGITNVRMRDANGFHVDISAVDRLPQDMTSIRMNVDSFEEAEQLLTAKGFTNIQGDKVGESPSARGTAFVSPTGFSIVVSQHIKHT